MKKERKFKKLIALLLCFVMVAATAVTAMPISVKATEIPSGEGGSDATKTVGLSWKYSQYSSAYFDNVKMQYTFYGSDGYECAAGLLNIDSVYGSEYKYNIEFPADAVYVEFIMKYDHEFVYMADASATCIKDGATTIVPGINANDLEYNGCKVYVSDFTDNLCIEVSAMAISTPGPTYSYLPVKLEQVDSQGNAAMVVDGLSSLKVDGISMADDEMIVYDYSSGYCTLEIEVAYGCSISKAYFNGTELDLKDSGDGVHYTAEFLRDVIRFDNTTNEIRLVSGGTSSDVTVVWTDSAERSQQLYGNDDAYVANGKVEVVSIQRGGQEIYNASMGNVENVVKITGEDGWVSLKKGDDVVLKLIPDYGYQLKSVDLNGCTAIPVDSSVSTFKIQNIQTNLHFKGIFEKSEDVINTAGSSLVKNAGIANGNHATASGNLSLTVADNKSYSRDVTGVVSGNAEKVAALDLTLDQVVSKGNGSRWINAITSFAQDINVSLSIDGSALKEGESFGVVRDHNGILTELNAVYDTKSGTLTFPTNQFSTYTIVKIADPAIRGEQAKNFVERMYTKALDRKSDAEGLDYWSDELLNNKTDAAGIAYGFFFGQEYTSQKLSDEAFVDDLYETILNRSADAEGKAAWVKALKEGKSRQEVLAGFVNSSEFSSFCDSYGISRGTMLANGSSVCNQSVRSFVQRNYTNVLGRKGETDGVESWCTQINYKKMTPAAVTESFFHSQEFKNRNLSDADYVEVLYQTYLGRGSDADGKAYWISCLKNGKGRDFVLKGFSNSQEFARIVADFGL